jgi:hypothetical protein
VSCPASRHFGTKEQLLIEYVTQVTALGPISLEYVNPGDDPRNK